MAGEAGRASVFAEYERGRWCWHVAGRLYRLLQAGAIPEKLYPLADSAGCVDNHDPIHFSPAPGAGKRTRRSARGGGGRA